MAVVDRLGPSLYASAGVAGQALNWARIPESEALTLADRSPPVWTYLHGLKSPLSSTALRALRQSRGRHPIQPDIQEAAAGGAAPATVAPEIGTEDSLQRGERKRLTGTQGG
jgi:nicotinate-nucleotide adenylyltransferase